MLSFDNQFERESVKFRLDSIVSDIWKAYSRKTPLLINSSVFKGVSVWGVYEAVLKTGFRIQNYTSDIGTIINESEGCKTCKRRVTALIREANHINEETFFAEYECFDKLEEEDEAQG